MVKVSHEGFLLESTGGELDNKQLSHYVTQFNATSVHLLKRSPVTPMVTPYLPRSFQEGERPVSDHCPNAHAQHNQKPLGSENVFWAWQRARPIAGE